jgi:hypothetical protein
MPISMRIDRKLHEKFPELHSMQRKSIDIQLQENVHSIGPYAKRSAPNEIVRPNAMMNAAFAKFFSILWDSPQIFSPYVAAGYAQDAAKLLEIHESIPNEPEEDRKLVDAWSAYAGLDKWYETKRR